VLLFTGLNGSLFVVDLNDPAITGGYRATLTQFDSSGKFVRTVGGVGRGPGEFQGWIGGVAQLKDGRILVTDAQGVLVFSDKGVPLTRWHAAGNSWASGGQLLVDPGGTILTTSRIPIGGPPGTPFRSVLFRFRMDGTLIDTVSPPQASFETRWDPYKMARTRVPFAPQYLSAWSPLGYFVTAYSSAYAVDMPTKQASSPRRGRPILPGQSGPVISLRRAVEVVPVQAAERADWKLSVTTYSRSPTPGRWESWQWSGPDIPSNKPPINLLAVDGDGRIWVRLAQRGILNPDVVLPTIPSAPGQGAEILARKRWVEPTVFDILDPEGILMGEIELPPGTGHPDLRVLHPEASFAAAGNIIWVAVYDDDGAPTIKRFRIAWPVKP
jgi:hypothetical protein